MNQVLHYVLDNALRSLLLAGLGPAGECIQEHLAILLPKQHASKKYQHITRLVLGCNLGFPSSRQHLHCFFLIPRKTCFVDRFYTHNQHLTTSHSECGSGLIVHMAGGWPLT